MKDLHAERALSRLPGGPAGGEAVHAEVVSTGDGHRLGVNVQTDSSLMPLYNSLILHRSLQALSNTIAGTQRLDCANDGRLQAT